MKGSLKAWFLGIGLVVSFFVPLASSVAQENQGALAEVKVTIDRIVKIAEEMAGTEASIERRAKLREIISERFDFDEMAKRSLGPEWAKLTAEEQVEFVKVFSDLLAKTYLNRVEKVTREMVSVEGETLNFPKSTVRSKVKSGGNVFPLDYRLQNVNGSWKVYDVVIENIGLVANYRNEFSGIIRSSGFAGLMEGLRAKAS